MDEVIGGSALDVDAYFGSINPIAAKIMQDVSNVKSDTEDWDSLSVEKQEELLSGIYFNAKLSEKYSDGSSKEAVEVFPVYKVKCGQKVVADFENEDNWSWQDEHSGPFSWRTKSQQDLTLDDDIINSGNGKSRRHHSSECYENGNTNTYKSEKNSWDNRFLSPDQQKTETEEEIFRKFGISFGAEERQMRESEDSTGPILDTEESSLLPSGDEMGNDNLVFEDDSPSLDYDSVVNNTETQNDEATSPTTATGVTLLLEDIGESSTDSWHYRSSDPASVVTSQPLSSTNTNSSTTEQTVTAPAVTGFDFLDNW